jgi:hypothetical protein
MFKHIGQNLLHKWELFVIMTSSSACLKIITVFFDR